MGNRFDTREASVDRLRELLEALGVTAPDQVAETPEGGPARVAA